MKILIEAIPRSGSTVLMKALAKIYRCIYASEPWIDANYYKSLPENFLKQKKLKNIVVKTMVTQIPRDGKWDDRLDIHTRLAKQFDIVICLGRKNKKEQVESFAHAMRNNVAPNEWHGRYSFINNISEEDYTKFSNQYDSHMSDLKLLAENLGKEIIWYEDLFSGSTEKVNKCLNTLPNEISYDNLKEYIDPKLKYRVSDKIFI